MNLLIDTNVLLRWSHADDPAHAICQSAVRKLLSQGHDICVCAQVLIEYWVNATRPVALNGVGMEVTEAEANLADITTAFPVLPEPPDMAARWQELVVQHRVVGRQAHDTRLAALMLAHGVAH